MNKTIVCNYNNQLSEKILKIKVKVNQLIESNHLRKCLKKYLEIINLIKNNEDTYFKQIYGETLKQVGKLLYQKMFQPNNAIHYLLDSLNIFTSLEYQVNDLMDIYLDLYNCYLKIGNSSAIILYGQIALSNNNLDSKTKCDINANIGRFCLLNYYNTSKKGNLIKAIAYSSSALEIYKSLDCEPKLGYINCLYDCGEICFNLDDIDLSLKYFEEVINLSDLYTIPNDLLLGLYTSLVQIYKIKGYKETELYYNKKLSELE